MYGPIGGMGAVERRRDELAEILLWLGSAQVGGGRAGTPYPLPPALSFR